MQFCFSIVLQSLLDLILFADWRDTPPTIRVNKVETQDTRPPVGVMICGEPIAAPTVLVILNAMLKHDQEGRYELI